MNILITARKFKARQTLKDFINSEVTSLKKYNDDILSADVKLSYLNSKDSVKSAEIILQVPGQILSATEETDEFEKSISSAVEKLSRQLKKLKTRKIQKVR
ncbi:MAG: ribosome-associated translation inhibitor RaiA [Ignavibacteriales bacterium]|nr:MAG: ribosome-associated translation inhibitor RaiA [Ignavibacteriales bacterium]